MTNKKGLKLVTPSTVSNTRKTIDADKKRAALKAGGSVKTKNKIDSMEICREVRGK
jgi:hypothetical protein